MLTLINVSPAAAIYQYRMAESCPKHGDAAAEGMNREAGAKYHRGDKRRRRRPQSSIVLEIANPLCLAEKR